MKKTLLPILGFSLILSAASQAASIVLVTDNTTTDANLITFLQGLGHTVSGSNGEYQTLDAGKIQTLNSADLVIVSRTTSSNAYAGDAAEVAQWDALTVPLLLTNPFIARSTHWGWQTTTTLNPDYVNDITPPTIDAGAHPIFQDLAGTFDGLFYPGALKFDPTASGGLNVLDVMGNMADSAVVLGVRNNTGTPWTIVAEFPQGAAIGEDRTLASQRMFLATLEGDFSNTSNVGRELYANTINYLIPEPGSALLSLLGLSLGLRRRR